jgi:hypothetical protein
MLCALPVVWSGGVVRDRDFESNFPWQEGYA